MIKNKIGFIVKPHLYLLCVIYKYIVENINFFLFIYFKIKPYFYIIDIRIFVYVYVY